MARSRGGRGAAPRTRAERATTPRPEDASWARVLRRMHKLEERIGELEQVQAHLNKHLAMNDRRLRMTVDIDGDVDVSERDDSDEADKLMGSASGGAWSREPDFFEPVDDEPEEVED